MQPGPSARQATVFVEGHGSGIRITDEHHSNQVVLVLSLATADAGAHRTTIAHSTPASQISSGASNVATVMDRLLV